MGFYCLVGTASNRLCRHSSRLNPVGEDDIFLSDKASCLRKGESVNFLVAILTLKFSPTFEFIFSFFFLFFSRIRSKVKIWASPQNNSQPPLLHRSCYPRSVLSNLTARFFLFIMSYRAEKSRHYRKNGSGYYQPRWKQQSDRPEDEPSTPPPPLGAMIKELQVTDLDERRKKFIDSEAASITSSETVTSYNWMHASPDGPYQPTIMIPGKPKLRSRSTRANSSTNKIISRQTSSLDSSYRPTSSPAERGQGHLFPRPELGPLSPAPDSTSRHGLPSRE